jgi:dihydroorotate dehydrogenase
MAEVLAASGMDGLICTNTTLDRNDVQGAPHAAEAGGLSGRPLRARADHVLQGMHARMGDAMPIVGVGGIVEGADAAEKLRLGARLVQLYTGLVYRGPHLLGECVGEILRQREDLGL